MDEFYVFRCREIRQTMERGEKVTRLSFELADDDGPELLGGSLELKFAWDADVRDFQLRHAYDVRISQRRRKSVEHYPPAFD